MVNKIESLPLKSFSLSGNTGKQKANNFNTIWQCSKMDKHWMLWEHIGRTYISVLRTSSQGRLPRWGDIYKKLKEPGKRGSRRMFHREGAVRTKLEERDKWSLPQRASNSVWSEWIVVSAAGCRDWLLVSRSWSILSIKLKPFGFYPESSQKPFKPEHELRFAF